MGNRSKDLEVIMEKELSEMSLEELWQLFPICLTKHQNVWAEWFDEEKNMLEMILPMDYIIRISHIGSTSLPEIWAKPIIDILVEVADYEIFEQIETDLANHGYICMCRNENRISFNKGYTKSGFAKKVFHLHLRKAGDNDELYFRDYLVKNKDIALQYEKLKIELWKKYEHNRDGYTNAKTEFVVKYTKKAKELYGDWYSC